MCRSRWSTVTAETLRPNARDSCDHAIRDLANSEIFGIGDVNITGSVDPDSTVVVQLGAPGGSPIAGKGAPSIASYSCNHAARQLAYAGTLADIDITRRIDRHAAGAEQLVAFANVGQEPIDNSNTKALSATYKLPLPSIATPAG